MSTPASSPGDGEDLLRLRLFVVGSSPRSGRAVANLRALGDDLLGGRYELEVVDIVSDPGRAEEERILATPTVIRTSPLPTRRVTGDLSRREEVLRALLPDWDAGPTPDIPDA